MTDAEHSRSPNITLVGGGTGSFTLLEELKQFTPNLTAVVNMSDDGGSTGVLRDELGVLPPGDIRQCLVALSNLPEVRDLFSFRFGGDGPLSGHTLGNLVLAGLEQQYDNFDRAIKVASKILQITGQVVPVTLENHTLVMEDGDTTIRGEYQIGHRSIQHADARVLLEPASAINPEADEAIRKADLVVIAPGNLYGSLLPALAVDGIREAFAETPATKVVVSNLVTKPGQTDGWHVVDYIEAFEQYIGEGQVNVALYNQNLPSGELLEKYAAEGEFPVRTDPSRFSEVKALPIGADLVAKDRVNQDPKDKAIRRTLIRHNAYRVGRQLMSIFYQ